MSYETAPSTLLVATNCACCGRPLRDAVSIERGVGPDCAEKFGYAEAQGPAQWNRATHLLSAAGVQLPEGWAKDAHAVVNKLVHLAACQQRKAPLALAGAVTALGYAKLGARLVERIKEEATIVVERVGEELSVKTPFSREFNREVVYIAGQRFDRAAMRRVVPASARVELWAALKKAFEPGTLVSCGEKVSAL